MDCGSIGIPASATASPALPDLIDRYEALVTKSEEQAWRHVIQGQTYPMRRSRDRRTTCDL
jgi:hypothetical protein